MLEIQPATILWTIVNLLILYFFFKKYLFGRVNAVLDSRAALVEQELLEADAQKSEAAKLRAGYEQKLSDAAQESVWIISQAQQRGQREYETLLTGAKTDAERLRQDTREQLSSEREAMLRSARREVATLALLTAAKVSGRTMDRADDRALVDAFLSEAGEDE